MHFTHLLPPFPQDLLLAVFSPTTLETLNLEDPTLMSLGAAHLKIPWLNAEVTHGPCHDSLWAKMLHICVNGSASRQAANGGHTKQIALHGSAALCMCFVCMHACLLEYWHWFCSSKGGTLTNILKVSQKPNQKIVKNVKGYYVIQSYMSSVICWNCFQFAL